MEAAGLPIESRFDMYDSLENEDDLSKLYETLSSVKDKYGNPAVFTAMTVPANIDFEKVLDSGYQDYYYEPLPITFGKLKGYNKVWDLWKEGIRLKLLIPQFHGREHLNLRAFKHLLSIQDKNTRTALENRSFSSFSKHSLRGISTSLSFDFECFNENKELSEIIIDGLNLFETVFGCRASHFNPPGNSIHSYLYEILAQNGIKYIDTALVKKEHQGNLKYKRNLNFTGKINKHNQVFLVRNCVFEPTEKTGFDWVNYTIKQIRNAFFWGCPAIISSHRVNFCGNIDECNRKLGLDELKKLLKKIVASWPDVEFMSADMLGQSIEINA